MRDRIYTVYELNCMVKEYLEDIPVFKDFFLAGEVSNITYYKSGHLYFTLKDDGSRINAIMFASSTKKLKFIPSVKDIKLYVENSNYRNCQSVTPLTMMSLNVAQLAYYSEW